MELLPLSLCYFCQAFCWYFLTDICHLARNLANRFMDMYFQRVGWVSVLCVINDVLKCWVTNRNFTKKSFPTWITRITLNFQEKYLFCEMDFHSVCLLWTNIKVVCWGPVRISSFKHHIIWMICRRVPWVILRSSLKNFIRHVDYFIKGVQWKREIYKILNMSFIECIIMIVEKYYVIYF